MLGLRRVPAISLLIAGCFSPNTPIVIDDSGSPTSGGLDTTVADSTDPSAPSTTQPTSADGDASTSASTLASTGTGSSDGGPSDASDTRGESSSSTGEPADCVGGEARTVWINFDGGTLEHGVIDNGPGWVTENEYAAAEWPPYDADAEGDVDEIMALLHQHWGAFDVCLTRDQPALADYELVIVSSTEFMNNPNYPGPGSAPECGDEEVNNVIVRTMPPAANLPTATKAISISEALGRSFGLEDVYAEEDLMNYAAGTTLNGATFTDVCRSFAYTQTCDGSPGCAADEQNSYALLLQVLGPA